MIDGSKRFLHLQAYIINNDSTGNRIMETMMSASARGVQVYMLADGHASQHLGKTWQQWPAPH